MRIGAVVGAILLFLIIGTFCTVGRRVHYTCIDCGLYFQDRRMLGLPFPIYDSKPRTRWYERRIGIPHPHRWSRRSCSAGLNIWLQPTVLSCGIAEPLSSSDGLADVLHRLETLDLDRLLHEEITDDRLDYRTAAMDAANHIPIDAKDPQVRAWWAKTRRYLGSPQSWPSGFQNFEK